MNPVVLFELSSQDPDRQAQFFSTVFGWEVSEPNWGYRTAKTGAGESQGIDGGIAQGPSEFPQGTRVQIQVENIDVSIAKALENGATVSQDKMDLGDCYLAYVVDPVGVQLGLIQYK
ncbi:VOC family protein [Cohnella suwonensis]|uniref:VOC family protein n=1 Tax=Cohnella suwonensis TaxID=696072 RepID=A0ABW0LNA8_9BACL